MPTKKRRVGFIPRSDVLDLINKLSYESNLSNSKIINILVEEALYKRGMFNIKTGKVFNNINDNNLYNEKKVVIGNLNEGFTSDLKSNLSKDENLDLAERNDYSLDKEIYEKFLMFLQFQEKMKRNEF